MARRFHLLCMGGALAATGLLALFVAFAPSGSSAHPSDVKDRLILYRSYTDTLKYFDDLKKKYPDLVETWYAQDLFPNILPNKESWANCEGQTCKTLIVRIANKKLLTKTTPEVFFSGALHGDERLGPASVTELATFLTEQYYAGNEDVKRLVDYRATWITPMTNAHGYAMSNRHENGMDPNRDFGYLQKPDTCMQTQTARTVNELFRSHLFHFMITFHGGMRALTYEWGSRDHMTGQKSTESPDNRAFEETGKLIRAAAGRDAANNQWWYPLGPITDLVYYVDGGMEDWSYAAGWESSPTPITVCQPKTYGGYSPDRSKYKENSIATLVYLAEMDDYKTPNEGTLGHTTEIWHADASNQGHVPRNLRMCLKLIEMTRPEVVIHESSLPLSITPGSELSITVHGFGCQQIALLRLLVIPEVAVSQCDFGLGWFGAEVLNETHRNQVLSKAHVVAELSNQQCRGLSLWEAHAESGFLKLAGQIPRLRKRSHCLFISAEFDKHWGQQINPDPHVSPRAHATRTRIEEHYEVFANDGDMMIKSFRTKLFAVRSQPFVKSSDVPEQVGQSTASTSISAPKLPSEVPVPTLEGVESKSNVETKFETSSVYPSSLFAVVFISGVLVGGVAVTSVLSSLRSTPESHSHGLGIDANVVGSHTSDEEVGLKADGRSE